MSSLADPAGSLAPGASTPGWAKPAQSGDPGASTPARATAARSGNPGAARRHWLEMTHHAPFPSETNCIARNGVMIDTLGAFSICPPPWTLMMTACLVAESIFLTM